MSMLDSARAWLLSTGQQLGILHYYESLRDNTTRLAWQDGEKKSKWRFAYIVAGICALALLPLAWAIIFIPGEIGHSHLRPATAPYTTIHWGKDWHGWHAINHMVVLGDSWSSTGFDLDGDQPSIDNPFGNPAFPGLTVTNGENWVDYLTYTYNESVILTADLAVGGATVDQDLIAPGVPSAFLRSLKVQVDEFKKQYASSAAFPWTANNTVFSVWVGVNDISAYTNKTRENFRREFDELSAFMDELHELGARNFLLFNAPPLDRSPIAPFSDPVGEWPEMIHQWNRNFSQVTTKFLADHNETTVFQFDIHTLYEEVIDEPCLFPETCGFMETTTCCDQYMFGAPTPDYKDDKCEYSIDKYFWLNRLHPSTKTHNMTAHVIHDALVIDQSSYG